MNHTLVQRDSMGDDGHENRDVGTDNEAARYVDWIGILGTEKTE